MPIAKGNEGYNHACQILLLLARGEQEIAAGEGFTLNQVFAEVDALLAGNRDRNSDPLISPQT